MSSLFEALPVELIRKILILAARDTKTLLRCERTCRTLRQIVGDDMTWKHLDNKEILGEDVRLQSNRDRACARTAIKAIRREKKRGLNILVDELGAVGWNDLVHSILSDRGPSLLNLQQHPVELNHHRFLFRGDTLYVLAALVQAHMVLAFQKTYEIPVELAEATGLYPVLTKRYFCHHDLFEREFVAEPNGLRYNGSYPILTLEHASELLGDNDDLLRERIIRRLSHRASVARMDNEVYDWAWAFVVQLIMQLIRPACLELLHDKPRYVNGQFKRRRLAFNQTIRTVPPHPTVTTCECCPDGRLAYVHTVVPGQIENAALSLVGSKAPNRVYGTFWLTNDFQTMDQAIAEAEDQYEWPSESEMETDLLSMDDDKSEKSETDDNASDNDFESEDDDDDESEHSETYVNASDNDCASEENDDDDVSEQSETYGNASDNDYASEDEHD